MFEYCTKKLSVFGFLTNFAKITFFYEEYVNMRLTKCRGCGTRQPGTELGDPLTIFGGNMMKYLQSSVKL